MPHSSRNAAIAGSSAPPSLKWPSAGSPAVRSSATSKPMPPAPMIATRRPARASSLDDLDVARDLRMVDAGDRRRSRHDAGGEDHVVEAAQVRRAGAMIEPQLDAGCRQAARESSAASRRTPPCRESRRARLNWPPISAAASNSVTSWPRSAAVVAQRQAGRPGADDGDLAPAAAGASISSVSRHAYGLTRQVAVCRSKIWSRQAWLQPMQVLISSARPVRRLGDEVGVGEERPRHRHHVGVAAREQRFGDARDR